MMKDQVPVPSPDNRKTDIVLLLLLAGLIGFIFIQPNADLPEQNENLLQHSTPIGRRMDHVVFRRLNNYQLRNDAPPFHSGQLITRDELLFNQYFRKLRSRRPGESSNAVDFTKEFVIAIACDSTMIPAQPEPVSLKVINEVMLQLDYRVPRIESMYDATASPVLLIAVPIQFWRTVLTTKAD